MGLFKKIAEIKISAKYQSIIRKLVQFLLPTVICFAVWYITEWIGGNATLAVFITMMTVIISTNAKLLKMQDDLKFVTDFAGFAKKLIEEENKRAMENEA